MPFARSYWNDKQFRDMQHAMSEGASLANGYMSLLTRGAGFDGACETTWSAAIDTYAAVNRFFVENFEKEDLSNGAVAACGLAPYAVFALGQLQQIKFINMKPQAKQKKIYAAMPKAQKAMFLSMPDVSLNDVKACAKDFVADAFYKTLDDADKAFALDMLDNSVTAFMYYKAATLTAERVAEDPRRSFKNPETVEIENDQLDMLKARVFNATGCLHDVFFNLAADRQAQSVHLEQSIKLFQHAAYGNLGEGKLNLARAYELVADNRSLDPVLPADIRKMSFCERRGMAEQLLAETAQSDSSEAMQDWARAELTLLIQRTPTRPTEIRPLLNVPNFSLIGA